MKRIPQGIYKEVFSPGLGIHTETGINDEESAYRKKENNDTVYR